MTARTKHIIAIILAIVVLLLAWYFRSIVAYILIAGVLSIVCRPLVDLLCKIHIGKHYLPRALSALLTISVVWGIVALFLLIFVPLISHQLNSYSSIDSHEIMRLLEEPLARLESFFRNINSNIFDDVTISGYVVSKIASWFNLDNLQYLFGTTIAVIGNTAIAVFAITFMSFFFLKDSRMFFNFILMWIPDKITENFTRALNSIAHLLTRYLIGILAESTGVMVIVAIGMTFVGIDFQQALVMGLVVGILNVIPYIGPWMGFFVCMLMGIASHISMDFGEVVVPLLFYMAIVVAVAQIVDNIFFQPFIYSSSVKAHPMEIFVIVLAAGSFAGVSGMVIAIPTYTAIRVLAKEFLIEFKAVKVITSSLDDDTESMNIFKKREKDKSNISSNIETKE